MTVHPVESPTPTPARALSFKVNSVVLSPSQTELVSGDQAGAVRVWDLQADACRQELVPSDYDYPADAEYGADYSECAAAR